MDLLIVIVIDIFNLVCVMCWSKLLDLIVIGNVGSFFKNLVVDVVVVEDIVKFYFNVFYYL